MTWMLKLLSFLPTAHCASCTFDDDNLSVFVLSYLLLKLPVLKRSSSSLLPHPDVFYFCFLQSVCTQKSGKGWEKNGTILFKAIYQRAKNFFLIILCRLVLKEIEKDDPNQVIEQHQTLVSWCRGMQRKRNLLITSLPLVTHCSFSDWFWAVQSQIELNPMCYSIRNSWFETWTEQVTFCICKVWRVDL